jgi:hypothetical protein
VVVHGQQMTFNWSAAGDAGGSGAWLVEEQQPDMATAPRLPVTLAQADNSVARLPTVSGSGHISSAAGCGHTQHRVSLLLQYLSPSDGHVSFVSSDAAHQLPHTPSNSRDQVIQCVARGPWGTCLPVAVVDVKMANMSAVAAEGKRCEEGLICNPGGEQDSSPVLVSLTVGQFQIACSTCSSSTELIKRLLGWLFRSSSVAGCQLLVSQRL